MNTEKIELFVKIAEMGNLTRAADVMGYTQSGATHILNSLENELGVKLLTRGRSGSSLTEGGSRLLEPAKELLYWERQLSEMADSISGDGKSILRIAGLPSVCRAWTNLITERMSVKNPDVKFEILAADNGRAEQFIVSGRADLGFIRMPPHKSLLARRVLRDPLLAVLPGDHPLARKKAVLLSDLAQYEFVRLMNDCHDEVNAATEHYGVKLNSRYSAYTIQDVLNLVRRGLGVSILPRLSCSFDANDLAYRPMVEELYRDIGLAAPKNRRPSILVRDFTDATFRLLEEGVIR